MTWQITEKKKYDTLYLERGYWPENVVRGYGDLCKNLAESIIGPFRLLDIGCGPGSSIEIARSYGIDAFGVDISSALTKYWETNEINAYVACADNLPFDDFSFDIITAWDVMEHIPKEGIPSCLMEMKRVAKNNSLISLIICLEEERHKHDGIQCHMTIESEDTWLRTFRACGLMVMKANLDVGRTHLLASLRVKK